MFRALSFAICTIAIGFFLVGSLRAVEPVTSVTVTRVENKVSYGKVVGDTSELRPAQANDVIKANDYLLSDTESRAELKYEDGTIVRIGQNTIFSFEPNTRTMNLKKGTFVFYMPKGKGGGTIKTPSFTAAITGTVAKVSSNIIAVIVGEITMMPSGQKVSEGFFARVKPDGTIEIKQFDPTKGLEGILMSFNGPLPGLTVSQENAVLVDFQKLGIQGTFDQVNNLPSAMLHFFGTQQPTPTPAPQKKPATPPPPPPPPTPTPQKERGTTSGPPGCR